MPEYVRVRLENGLETTVTAEKAEASDLEILDEPSTGSRGVLPVTKNGRRLKPRAEVDEVAAKKSPAKRAARKRPRRAAKKTSASTAAKPDTSGKAADKPEEQS